MCYFLLLTRLHYKLNLIFFVYVKAKLAARDTLEISLSPHGSVWRTAVSLVLWWECSLEMRTSVPSALSFLCHPAMWSLSPKCSVLWLPQALGLCFSPFPSSLSPLLRADPSGLLPMAPCPVLSLSCHHRCRLEPAQITLCCCPAFSGWPRFGRPGLPGAS